MISYFCITSSTTTLKRSAILYTGRNNTFSHNDQRKSKQSLAPFNRDPRNNPISAAVHNKNTKKTRIPSQAYINSIAGEIDLTHFSTRWHTCSPVRADAGRVTRPANVATRNQAAPRIFGSFSPSSSLSLLLVLKPVCRKSCMQYCFVIVESSTRRLAASLESPSREFPKCKRDVTLRLLIFILFYEAVCK